jgi:hypothetical protein
LRELDIQTPHFGFCEEVAVKARARGYKVAFVTIPTRYGDDLHKYSFKAQMRRGMEIPWTIVKWRWIEEQRPKLTRRTNLCQSSQAKTPKEA